MKKILIFLTVNLITALLFSSCAAKSDVFDFKVTKMWGDKYFARLEVDIERKNGSPIKELDIVCSSEDADISYSDAFFYEKNVATANLDISWNGVLSGISDEIGLNGKSVKVVFTEITVDGVKYTGNWTFEHTINVQTESKHLYLSDSKPKNDLRFLNIEISPYSIIYCGEVNDLPRENAKKPTFYRKDGSKAYPQSSSLSVGWADDSLKSGISGVLEFPFGIDINDIGYVEFDGEKYALTDKEVSPTL